MRVFKGKILVIGFGAIGRCTLPVLFQHLDIKPSNITILDFEDRREIAKPWTDKGVKLVKHRINQDNLQQTLAKYVASGDAILDLSWNIATLDMLKYCAENNILYINSAVELWTPFQDLKGKSVYDKSLYSRQQPIEKLITKYKGTATAVLDHGANPGLISHFTKQGLVDIAGKLLKDKDVSKKQKDLVAKLLADKDFPHLAHTLGVKVIHCSELDTQVVNKPKVLDEFCNTWSVEGFQDEGSACAEMGWGTHETVLPSSAILPKVGPKNQIFLSQMGINTWVRSFVPNQEIIGMVVRHGEAYTISKHLSVFEKGKCIYRPTVHYAYQPCNEALASLHELRARNYKPQSKERLLTNEIIQGEDILGALLMGHKYDSWWTGSILGIEESRKLAPNQSATTVQVAAGIVSSFLWALANPNQGICVPDDLPHEEILKFAKPYLGKFISKDYDWTPAKNREVFFKENKKAKIDAKNLWGFHNFRFTP